MNSLIESIKTSFWSCVVYGAMTVVVVLIAYLIEKRIRKETNSTERVLSTRKIVVIGMFSAIATVLMLFDIPVFFAPSFYKFDFSDLPAMICGFAYGPVTGLLIEFIKIMLKLVTKGTSTVLIGEFANFMVGAALIIPSSVCYSLKKTKKNAMLSCILGTVAITVVGGLINALFLIPAFAKLYGMPVEAIVEMGSAIIPAVKDVWTLAFLCAAPLCLLKGVVNSLITMFAYKPLHRILKGN